MHSWFLHYKEVRSTFHTPAFISRHQLNMKLGRPQIRNRGREKSLATAGNRIADRQNRSLFTTPTTLSPTIYKATENQSRTTRKNIHIVPFTSGTILDTNVAFEELPILIEFSLIPLN
jgi:hypothetical protein